MPATTLVDRAVIRLSGENVRGFLQALVTSDVAGPLPVWTALLTPQGKCQFDFFVWEDGKDLLLDCEAEAADDLVKRLAKYRLRRPITIERDETLAVHWSSFSLERLSVLHLVQPGSGPTKVVKDPRSPNLGNRWIAVPQEPASDWVRWRLWQGVCEGRAELADLLWLECNAVELNGVSFTKGCFVGQENTARMNWRSKVNRRLFVVEGQADRARVSYPDFGLSVVHVRLDAVPPNALIPDWLQSSITA